MRQGAGQNQLCVLTHTSNLPSLVLLLLLQLSSYLMVFLEHLDDCAKAPGSTHGRRDYLPHELFFRNTKVELKPQFIWDRRVTAKFAHRWVVRHD